MSYSEDQADAIAAEAAERCRRTRGREPERTQLVMAYLAAKEKLCQHAKPIVPSPAWTVDTLLAEIAAYDRFLADIKKGLDKRAASNAAHKRGDGHWNGLRRERCKELQKCIEEHGKGAVCTLSEERYARQRAEYELASAAYTAALKAMETTREALHLSSDEKTMEWAEWDRAPEEAYARALEEFLG